MIRVVAIEDDPRYRASLETLLRYSPDFELVEAFAAPAAALERVEDGRRGEPPAWDLVLMDLELPGMSGVECTRRIKASLPETTVVVLTVFEDRATVLEAICAGADGYLLKHTPADRLLAQLRSVLAGGSPLSSGIARIVLDLVRQGRTSGSGGNGDGADRLDLTPREQDVLRCLVQGMSYKQAGRALGIRIDTVRTYIRGIYGKLQVHSVAEAVGRAIREGLV